MKRIIFAILAVLISIVFLSSAEAAKANEVKLEKIVVTPARMPQKDYNITSNITVIDGEEIRSSSAKYIGDILRKKPGINIYDSSIDKTVKVDIRGFADTSVSNILVLVDGRKVNSIDISGPDWLQIPIETVERIEVIRGGASVLYGDNAVGGVVNIITKKGKPHLSGRVGVKCGSYDMNQEDMEISGSKDRLLYYIYSKFYETDGYRSNSDVRTKDYNGRVDYNLSENLSLDLTTGWHEDDYGMPGGLNDNGELTQYARRGSANENDYASTKDRYLKLSTRYKPWFDVTDSASLDTDIFYRNRDAYSWFDYGVWGATATKYMINTQGLNSKYTYKGYLLDREFDFVTGLDYYDVDHIIKGSGSGASVSSDDLTIYKKELGFYGYSDYELFKKFWLNAGVRYQKARYRFDQRASSVRYETRKPSETVMMGGVKYEYADGCIAHFSFQETFRFLATDEWYSTWSGLNTNLQQQTGVQYEIGIRHKLSDALAFEVTPYRINLKNEIYLNPYPSPGQNENYDKTMRKGIEFNLDMDILQFTKVHFLDKLELYTSYTYQQAKFKAGDYSNKDIPMVPRQQAGIGLKSGFLGCYLLSLDGRVVGERYAINDTRNETPKVKGYFVLDGTLSYTRAALEIYGAVNNIFNKKYCSYAVKSASSTLKDYYPSPERNFEIGVRYKF